MFLQSRLELKRLFGHDFFFPKIKRPDNLGMGTLGGQVSTICGSGGGADTYGYRQRNLQQCNSDVGCQCDLVIHSTLQGNTEVLVDPRECHWLLPVLHIYILQGQILPDFLFMLSPSEDGADFFLLPCSLPYPNC